jgi:hypothetical protein
MPTPEKFQTPEELGRQLYLERLKARKARAQEPKEGIVEKVKTKMFVKALSWIAVAIFDAFFDIVPTYVLRYIPVLVKAKNKGWAMIGLIFNCCIDLFGIITLNLSIPVTWVIDVVAAPLNIYIEMRCFAD